MLVQAIFQGEPAQLLEAVARVRQLLSIEDNPPIQPILDAGLVPKFVDLLKVNSQQPGNTLNAEIQFEACWALTNIASGNAAQTTCVIENGAIPVFCQVGFSDGTQLEFVRRLHNQYGSSIMALTYVGTDEKYVRVHTKKSGVDQK